jgi:hypothetical protein
MKRWKECVKIHMGTGHPDMRRRPAGIRDRERQYSGYDGGYDDSSDEDEYSNED